MAIFKTEHDFRATQSLREWITIHFESGDMAKADQQLAIAFGIVEQRKPRTTAECLAVWGEIVEALADLPWSIDPSALTKEDLDGQVLGYWVDHFFMPSDLALGDAMDANYGRRGGDSWDAWQALCEANAAALDEWQKACA